MLTVLADTVLVQLVVPVVVTVDVAVTVVCVAVMPVPPEHTQQMVLAVYPKFSYWSPSSLQKVPWA